MGNEFSLRGRHNDTRTDFKSNKIVSLLQKDINKDAYMYIYIYRCVLYLYYCCFFCYVYFFRLGLLVIVLFIIFVVSLLVIFLFIIFVVI